MGKGVSLLDGVEKELGGWITIVNSIKPLNKAGDEARETYVKLSAEQRELEASMVPMLRRLTQAREEFVKTGSDAAGLRMRLAGEEYDSAAVKLEAITKNAQQAGTKCLELSGAISKVDNRAGTAGSLFKSFAKEGGIKLVGGVVTNVAGAMAGSAFGTEGGTLVSGALSTAVSGAAMGAAIGSAAPVVGTLIGAAAGAVLGLVDGAVKNYQAKEDAFQDYVQSTYKTVTEEQRQTLTSGSAVAASREQDRITFGTLLGDEEKGGQYLSEIRDYAQTTAYSYESVTSMARSLLNEGYSGDAEQMKSLLTSVGDAGSALGMGEGDMADMASALGRMNTADQVTMAELTPLLERNIDVWSYLAEKMELSPADVMKLVNDGQMSGEEAFEAITGRLSEDYGGKMEERASSYSGLTSSRDEAKATLNAAMGEGYNKTRKTGLEKDIAYMTGESGEPLSEAYSMIGQWQASLENQSEQYEREAMEAVMGGGDITSSYRDEETGELSESGKRLQELAAQYETLKKVYNKGKSENAPEDLKRLSEEAVAKMGGLLAEAQVIAANEYNASDGAQLALKSNVDLAERIRQDTKVNESYWDAGYQMSQQFSKGFDFGISSKSLEELSTDYIKRNNISIGVGTDYIRKDNGNNAGLNIRGHAFGINYVPYNNYPALLHEGERVLTAVEARSYGGAAKILISGNSFTVRSEADVEAVAKELARQLNMARIVSH